jgi:hypothetical protein
MLVWRSSSARGSSRDRASGGEVQFLAELIVEIVVEGIAELFRALFRWSRRKPNSKRPARSRRK